MEARNVVVIGAGISGLAAAAALAQQGARVTVLEKNQAAGGRARTWETQGFRFDMGPSFYWMPDVFERFFGRFGQPIKDFLDLRRLDPSYQVIFGEGDRWLLPAGCDAVAALFGREEPGADAALGRFLDEARLKYDLGMKDAVYLPSLSWAEYLRPRLVAGLLSTTAITPLRRHVRKHFISPRIRQVLEFPSLFLGSVPQRTPALYSLMNHADIDLGTWYPMGGMGKVPEALCRLAERQGATVRTGEEVSRIVVEHGQVTGVQTANGFHQADVVLATADRHHVEQRLLDEQHRSYTERYWASRVMAPGTLLFFIGLDRKLPGMTHHTLYFDAPLDDHAEDLASGRWPRNPLFYLSCTSVTDPSTAPPGCENLVLLVPVPSGGEDTPALRNHVFGLLAERIRRHAGVDIRPHITVFRSHGLTDLQQDYHAFRGNAYGLASTLRQTGPGRPAMRSRKVKGLYFAGQLGVPGPGMPPALISGQVAADLILKDHGRT